MGIFDIFKKKESNNTATKSQGISADNNGNIVIQAASLKITDANGNVTLDTANLTPTSGIDLRKEKVKKIDLRKEKISTICLTKDSLGDLKARVVFAIDYSGSMRPMYNNGRVQELVERCLPLALRFDDDKSMGMWRFDDNFKRLPDMDIENFHGYVQQEIMKGSMGGTNYGGVINDICKQYINKEPADIPTYVLFITDGDCWDSSEAERAIKNASKHNIFWQFVGIGSSDFNFLQKLDDMPGRFLDNADFFACNDISSISDEELYKRILNEFDGWVVKAREKGLIK